MFAAILTWAGAILGVAVLLLMAIGPAAIDSYRPRNRKREPVDKL